MPAGTADLDALGYTPWPTSWAGCHFNWWWRQRGAWQTSMQTRACALPKVHSPVYKTGLLLSLIILSAWLLLSCARGEKSSTGADPVASEILLTPADEHGLKAVLEKSRGRVIVLNFWATWCEPCREEFPDLLKLHGNYRQKGLSLILLSMDETDQGQAVKKFLREKGVNFESYIRSKSDFEAFVNSVDPNWIGGIPATFIFDRRGNRVTSLLGPQKYENLEGVVRSLL